MSSKPERRKELYQEKHKDDFPIKALNAAITECTKALRSIQHSLKKKATHCLRGHLRTPETVRENGTCVICDRTSKLSPPKPPKTHCKHGHPWVPENDYCKACDKAAYERKSAEKKATAAAKKIIRDAPWVDSRTGKLVSKERRGRLQTMGWTQQMVETTLYEQGNVCGLCRKPFTDKDKACADHAHTKPPEPRGVLHSSCNAAIGLLRENPETCRAAADYLEAWA